MTQIFEPRRARSAASISREGGVLLRRWLGTWIDFLVLGAPFILLGAAGELHSQTLSRIGAFAFLAYVVLYYPITEGFWGRSVGKLVAGTVVVTRTGRRPGFWRAVVRTLLRLVEVNPFFLGGIPAGIIASLTPDHQRLGDLASGTYVIRMSDLYKTLPGPGAPEFDELDGGVDPRVVEFS